MHDNLWLCIMNLGKIISFRAFPNSFKEVRFLLTSKMVSMTPRLLADEFKVRDSVIITLRNSNTHFLTGWEIRRVWDEKTVSVSAPGSPSFSLSDPSWMKETQQFLRLRNYIIIMFLSSVLKFSVRAVINLPETSVITVASHKGNIIISQCVLTVKIGKLPKARENVGDAVFVLYSDWLRRWREFSRPITERGKTKIKHSQIT